MSSKKHKIVNGGEPVEKNKVETKTKKSKSVKKREISSEENEKKV